MAEDLSEITRTGVHQAIQRGSARCRRSQIRRMLGGSWSCERKIQIGSAAGDDVGNRAPRAAAHGPAQRAMTGVQEKIGDAGRAHIGNIGRGQRPQSAPVHWVIVIAGVGKQLACATRDRFAAGCIEFSGIAIDLAGAGHAQTISEPRDHQFVPIIGE